MTDADETQLAQLKRVFFVVLVAGLTALTITVNVFLSHLQNGVTPDRPFGVFKAQGGLMVQDFSYNMLYFRGIRDHVAARPYTLEDQEKIARHYVPRGATGLSHAYSPVGFVLVQPLLLVPGRIAYLLYTALCALGIVLLFYFYLLPRVEDRRQVYALAFCVLGLPLITAFEVGQSSLFTTTVLGAFWFLLQQRAPRSGMRDLALAILFWAICLKPSVGPVPLALLVGERAWRPLLAGFALLALTWLAVGPLYGGWLTGLQDYASLLNHYNNNQLTPFMQRGAIDAASAGHPLLITSVQIFAWKRNAFFVALALFIGLRWAGKIGASTQFQGTVWTFLLLSPYLLSLENWVMCLLVVEGAFFRSGSLAASAAKLLLLLGIMDLRAGVTFPYEMDVPLKWILALWILVEGWRESVSVKNCAAPR